MSDHIHFALSTGNICKKCGRKHGFITVNHRIVIADENMKHLLEEFSIKHPESEVIEIDVAFLKSRQLYTIHIEFILGHAGFVGRPYDHN